ncbi:hypothetical protein [Lujinxingia vulgaris]|nr:hypothetical protein [Lujinxingia vulgaris]
MKTIAEYVFGRSTQKNHVEIHAAMVMSNHLHIILTDLKGRRSDFMRDAMSSIARARNKDLERSDHFWDGRQYCDTILLDRDAEERKLLYTWLNPVVADLVERADQWPGFKIMPRDWGKPMRVPKPDVFFGRRSPEYVEFIPQPPPGYSHMSLEEVKAHFEDLLKKAEDALIAAREREKRPIGSVDAILAIDPFSRPSTPSPAGKLSPRFASKNPDTLIAAIARERAFRSEYARQRERWLKGQKRVVFPCGTVWLRYNAPITCQDLDPTEAGLACTM